MMDETHIQKSTIDSKAAHTEDDGVVKEDNTNQSYRTDISNFINNTSLDDMHAIAEAALRKKMAASDQEPTTPKWVFPEGGIQP